MRETVIRQLVISLAAVAEAAAYGAFAYWDDRVNQMQISNPREMVSSLLSLTGTALQPWLFVVYALSAYGKIDYPYQSLPSTLSLTTTSALLLVALSLWIVRRASRSFWFLFVLLTALSVGSSVYVRWDVQRVHHMELIEHAEDAKRSGTGDQLFKSSP